MPEAVEGDPPRGRLPLPFRRGVAQHLGISRLSNPRRTRHPRPLATISADHSSGTWSLAVPTFEQRGSISPCLRCIKHSYDCRANEGVVHFERKCLEVVDRLTILQIEWTQTFRANFALAPNKHKERRGNVCYFRLRHTRHTCVLNIVSFSATLTKIRNFSVK